MRTQTIEDTPECMVIDHENNSEREDLLAFQKLRAVATAFGTLDARLGIDEAANHHMVVSQIHALLAHILELENRGVARETIRDAVSEVRQIHAQSPIIARMQNWPRGYVGDYETVEIILSGRCVSPKGTLAHYLERYVLDCPASQQHRNKVLIQAELIRSTIDANPDATILIVACGRCPDLKTLSRELKGFRGQLWLMTSTKTHWNALQRGRTRMPYRERLCQETWLNC